MGEATGKHTIRARRVDVAVYKKNTNTITPPKIIADFYLIDGSGSMAGDWNFWTYAIRYWKPRHARVFVSNDSYIPRGQNISWVRPNGGTEIWFSYWSILDLMTRGQTLIIISDFDSNVSLTPGERAAIEQKARQKGVIVRAVRI